jgi:CheY-like chemotaxis protein
MDLERGSYVVIEVCDNGSGMTREVLAHAFEPFFTTKPVGSGSGLGLSTCYGIVRQANGRIGMESEVGRGTTVRIHLPLTLERLRSTSLPARSEAPRGGGETILVVEDEPAVCAVTRRILERGGYRVLVAGNGLEALSVAEGHPTIALVVTDVTMPGMGGEELGVELRRRGSASPILYVSGYASSSLTRYGVVRAEIEFLAKPFTSQALLERVRRLIQARARR